MNDDDDVQTVQTANVETLLPVERLNNNNNIKTKKPPENLEQDYPSDPNETDQVSHW
jgi:hypothetical protein